MAPSFKPIKDDAFQTRTAFSSGVIRVEKRRRRVRELCMEGKSLDFGYSYSQSESVCCCCCYSLFDCKEKLKEGKREKIEKAKSQEKNELEKSKKEKRKEGMWSSKMYLVYPAVYKQ